MQRIRILSDDIVNRIAAGEVVERPASIVKELVENSIDAGSSRIVVEVADGGKRLVKVMDDGEGMSRDDAILSIERHATSKIQDESDLFAIRSMGFRGEALSSIAAVSRLELSTRVRGEEEGTRIYAEGGRIRKVETCGIPAGTMVAVKNIFFNTPARRKFLKSAQTEMVRILEIYQRLVLPFCETTFELIRDGRSIFFGQGQVGFEERALLIFGKELLGKTIPLDFEDEEIGISGIISRPSFTMSSTNHILLYVNRRYIKDRLLYSSLMSAYGTMIEKGRFPLAIVMVRIAPELVDVNVHPTKSEVRWRNPERIYDALKRAVLHSLKKGVPVTTREGWTESSLHRKEVASPISPEDSGRDESRSLFVKESVRDDFLPSSIRMEDIGEPVIPEVRFFDELVILCQFRGAYLIGEWRDSIVIIDQHAAHERVMYERLKRFRSRDGNSEEILLFSSVVELKKDDYEVLLEHLSDVRSAGIEIEPFSERSFAIRSIPRFLKGIEPSHLLLEMADVLKGEGRGRLIEDKRDLLIARLACISSIRGRRPMSIEEAYGLIKELSKVDFRFSCPHGRPIIVRIPLYSIERVFKRK